MNAHRRIVLASRPEGAAALKHFRMEADRIVPLPEDGEVLLRTIYLSLDPYMRGRMNEGESYAKPVEVDEVMVGETVSVVTSSRNPAFQVGQLVLSHGGWQEYAVSDGSGLSLLDSKMPHPSHALSVSGMPGFTAYYGVLKIGQPKAGETLVVAAAIGPVGSIAGQIAKRMGCRVVGIAGGEEKCRYAVETLGFDACIDRRQKDFAIQLAEVCPQGVDIYFENVGGEVFEAVWDLLNVGARVPVCGLISQYDGLGTGPTSDRLPGMMMNILMRRIKVEGFIILDHYGTLFEVFQREVGAWLAEGVIHFQEQVVEGLENAPSAFLDMMQGRNFGKVIVQVSEL